MPRTRVSRLRSAALAGATVLLGISWSFTLVHVRTTAYPFLWSAAMPLLAFYYAADTPRPGLWKHLPAAAISLYALVLWHAVHGDGVRGVVIMAVAIPSSLLAVWLGGRCRAAATVPAGVEGQAPSPARSRRARARRLRTRPGGVRR
jgi:hypothetical protein